MQTVPRDGISQCLSGAFILSIAFDFVEIAQRDLRTYERSSDAPPTTESPDRFDESGIAAAVSLLRFIEDGEDLLTRAAAEGRWDPPSDFPDSLRRLYTGWLKAAGPTKARIEAHRERGIDEASDDEFLRACERVESWLERNDFLDAAMETQNALFEGER